MHAKDLPPGVTAGIADSDYHAMAAVGSTGLKRFAVSPLHYWADYLDPEREKKDSVHFVFGRAWHCGLFEPAEFSRRYATGHDVHPATKRAVLLASVLGGQVELAKLVGVPDDLKLTTKEGKALAAEIEAAGNTAVVASDLAFVTEWHPKLAGREVLSPDAVAKIERMVSVARALPISQVIFGQLAEHGRTEHSLFYVDPASGVTLKVRPDYMLMPCPAFPCGLIVDGKTTDDAGLEGFGRSVWNLEYGLQAALYTRVYQALFRTAERPPFMWLAQEKDRPHAAQYFSAGADLLEYWDRRIDRLLAKMAACQASNTWPGYPTTVSVLALPDWANKAMENAA